MRSNFSSDASETLGTSATKDSMEEGVYMFENVAFFHRRETRLLLLLPHCERPQGEPKKGLLAPANSAIWGEKRAAAADVASSDR